jgi:hypothetical protein
LSTAIITESSVEKELATEACEIAEAIGTVTVAAEAHMSMNKQRQASSTFVPVLLATLVKTDFNISAALEATLPAVVRAFAEGEAPLLAAPLIASTLRLCFQAFLKLELADFTDLLSLVLLLLLLFFLSCSVRFLVVVRLLLISFMPASAACSSESWLSPFIDLFATFPVVAPVFIAFAAVVAAILRDFLKRRFQLLFAVFVFVVLALEALLLCEVCFV